MTRGDSVVGKHLVRGAEFECAYLDDLTTVGTYGTPYTNPFDWARLHAAYTNNPRGVQGLQIDGYFLDDDSETTQTPGNYYGKLGENGEKKYPCDSQFVIRFPHNWEGKLVITGAPGVRGQYANDFIISDWVLSKGYAFASTDKGNSGLRFYSADRSPGAAVYEWHRRVKQLTEAAKEAAERYYGEEPVRTYVTGNSNGGYLTRYALENHPDLYDGGVDWQGPLWTDPDAPTSDPDGGPNLLTFLPPTLRHYPEYRDAKSQAAYDALIKTGFPEGTVFLWPYHYENYWGSTQRIYREEFDPYYPGAEADYDYEDSLHPQEKDPVIQGLKQAQVPKIKNGVNKASLTGDIGKCLITLHGTLDALLPITKTSDKYAELVKEAKKGHLHRYYKIEGGTHIDSLYDYTEAGPNPENPDPQFRENLRPILPCYRAAFERLVEWVEEEKQPPEIESVPRPEDLDARELANRCPTLES
jgi:hypothetical protein